MKINVFPRSYFAARTGTPEEKELLRTHRIISLNSSSGSTAMPPFSNLHESNLLYLTVDDIVWTIRGMVLFNMEHAQKIWNFVENNQLPLMIHCNAGISRSGAVGEVLNWYFNSHIQQNPEDFQTFYSVHPQIVPNSHIKTVLFRYLEEKSGLSAGTLLRRLDVEKEKYRSI